MPSRKVEEVCQNNKPTAADEYDHYVAVDWSIKVMAIARLTKRGTVPLVVERPADLSELREYLMRLNGSTILTVEETTTAQWLYMELRKCVTRIVICDPYRNRLLSDGPKTDKIDAQKLCALLRAGLLKEVFHGAEKLYQLRRLVSAYEDVVKAGVRAQNQRSSVLRGEGSEQCRTQQTQFILDNLDKSITLYRETKAGYEQQFEGWCQRDKRLRAQCGIPGIGMIGAVKIQAYVIDAHRFPKAGHYLSYCGLVNLEKTSGKRCYGYRKPRFNHTLKSVYKSAALAAMHGHNPMREYFEYLLSKKGVAEHHARHAVARYIAKVSYGMLKSGEQYQPYKWRPTDSVA